MPIKVPDNLPAKEILQEEGIFVMNESRAFRQDIRPLKIVILNLMPLKQVTEVQLLRLIGNTPIQIEVKFLHMESHVSKNTSAEYLSSFYKVFNEISMDKFDGMIITGAPIERLEFEDVVYWEEIKEIMKWTKSNVTSTLHICWGAQAGLYYHYNVPKYNLDKKLFGVFKHYKTKENSKIMKGFDDFFYVPHSRHTEIRQKDIEKIKDLEILSLSEEAGVYIVASKDGKQFFITGHSEYDENTLADEYFRDLGKGKGIEIPKNYFKENDPNKEPLVYWRCHAGLLFLNWLHHVYQETPYEL